jgi:hypothetical protein
VGHDRAREGDAMAATARRWNALSDEELGRLLSLLKGADSVELKLTVPDGHQRSAVAALGMDPLQAQVRQVFFFDTPELTLDGVGLDDTLRRWAGPARSISTAWKPADAGGARARAGAAAAEARPGWEEPGRPLRCGRGGPGSTPHHSRRTRAGAASA